MNPEDNRARWLAVIRHAEGTVKNKNPYGTAFTGAQFDNSKIHDGKVRGSASGYQSDAAGAYQFKLDTWTWVNNGNLPMTKENQDNAATKLAKRRGVDINTAPFTQANLAKLSPEWASFPTLAGKSYYGQPVKSYKELLSVFNNFKPPTFTERAAAVLNKWHPGGLPELPDVQIKKTENSNPLSILGNAVKHSLQILGNKR